MLTDTLEPSKLLLAFRRSVKLNHLLQTFRARQSHFCHDWRQLMAPEPRAGRWSEGKCWVHTLLTVLELIMPALKRRPRLMRAVFKTWCQGLSKDPAG